MSIRKKNQQLESIIGYTPPKLYTGKNGKDWYIGFYAFDPELNKMRLKRIKINHVEKISERRKYASDLIIRLSEKLRAGYNPFIEQGTGKGYMLFADVCLSYERTITRYLKDGILREDTYTGYMSYMRNLIKYNTSLPIPITYIYQLNKDYANNFLNHIYIDRGNCPQTRDNYLGWLRVFASYLTKNSYHSSKFTDGLDVLGKRSIKKQRTVIPPNILDSLKTWLTNHNKHYLLACYILHYCFIRPKEMSKIKIGDISVKHQTIFVSGDIAKNRCDAVVTLNKKIITLMIDLEVLTYPTNYYLFSSECRPGLEYRSEKQFRDYWHLHLRPALKLKPQYKFYSLKDTGVTTMLRNNVDKLSIRDQARWHSVLMADIYTPHDIQDANELLKDYDTDF